MKTKHIKIDVGESVELYIRKNQRTIQRYSTIGEGEKLNCDAEQKSVNSGLRASMVVVGPATISLVRSKEKVIRPRRSLERA
jgi:hypothetical protein